MLFKQLTQQGIHYAVLDTFYQITMPLQQLLITRFSKCVCVSSNTVIVHLLPKFFRCLCIGIKTAGL